MNEILAYTKDLDTNLKVIGGVGTGKTTSIKLIIKELSKSYKVLVLDPGGEYLDINSNSLKVINMSKVIKEASKNEFRDFLISDSLKDIAKQYDFVALDETYPYYENNVAEFVSFLTELNNEDVKVIASFQEIPPFDIDTKFPNFLSTK